MASKPFGGTKSTFGEQTASRRRSAPSYGFGSGTREGQEKIFVSPEHAKLSMRSSHTGGPQYDLKSAVGSQVDSGNASAPQWAFGTAGRFSFGKTKGGGNPGPGQYDASSGVGVQHSSKNGSAPIYGFGSSTREQVGKVFITENHNKSLFGVGSPGPCTYTLSGAVGKQVDANHADQPAWVFGSSQRFVYDHVKRAATSPGPGSYAATNSVGRQVASTKASTPRFGFGTSNRQHQEKVYLSPDHEKAAMGRQSPGPGNYSLPPGAGQRQAQSNIHTASAWGFGTANRFAKTSATGTPGPGSYVI